MHVHSENKSFKCLEWLSEEVVVTVLNAEAETLLRSLDVPLCVKGVLR